jgi:hypothetical protein
MDYLPAPELLEDRAMVVSKNDDVDVAVLAGDFADPGVDSPAATEGPRRREAGHGIDNVCHVLGHDEIGCRQEVLLVVSR